MNKCPLCLSSSNTLIYTNSRGAKYLENYVCDYCGFIYTFPRISNEEIKKLYLEGNFSQKARKSSEPDLKKFIQTESWALERLHLLEQKIPDFFRSKKYCLEVGCGTGSFLWLLKSRGFVVKGIEPDSKFVNQATLRYKIDVENLLFENFEENNTFDLICSFHVIEHVLNPREFLKDMYKKLKDNGYVYLECPTIDNIYTNNLDTFFWDVHVNTFSNVTLPWLLESEGFIVFDVFMNRGFLCVLAKKGSEKKFHQDKRDRIIDIITKYKNINKKNVFKKIANRTKRNIKKLLK